MHETISVLVVDDQQLVLDGITSLLGASPHIRVAGTAKDGNEALQFLRQNPVDVVLLDINMPNMDGLETCTHIASLFPLVKTLALSTYSDGSMITQMIKNGASGYVLKDVSAGILTKAIEDVHKGERVLDAKLTERMLNTLQHSGMYAPDKPPRLTRRETEILMLIADELTTQQIAEKLDLSINTVLSHRKNIFAKFDVNTSIGLIKQAYKFGFLD